MQFLYCLVIFELLTQDDDHDAEEWERYEAFHDDVDKQVKNYAV